MKELVTDKQLVTDRHHGNIAYFCNGKDPLCKKDICYLFGGDCCRTTDPKYRLTPILVNGVKLDTRLEPFGDKYIDDRYIEVFNNSLSPSEKTKLLNEVPDV